MKKVGIITFHRAHNYGAVLQAYALSKVLVNKDVEIINYYNNNIYDYYNVFRPIVKNPLKTIKRFFEDLINYSPKKKRYNCFNEFIEKKMKLSEFVNDIEKLVNVVENKDCLITGSDQVWSKKIVGELSDIYTLNFGSDKIRRISYAASVGDASQIAKNSKEFKNKLSKIEYLSVREEDARDELQKIVDKPVNVVLDPTLLLTQSEWNKELENLDSLNEKYILAYVVTPDEEYIKIVNDLSMKTGLKVVHFGLKNPGYKNVLKSAYTEGPLEFVNYIKNAQYVIATSFHATVFSIIFNKKFFIIPHRKTGARVVNLVQKLGIQGRIFNSLQEFKSIDYDFETNWENVSKKLDFERKKSLEWLQDALGKGR